MPVGGKQAKQAFKIIEQYPLSDADIHQLLTPDTRIFTYADLNSIDDIDQLFDSEGRAIMLFATESPTVGHWIALHKNGDSIEYFDPYGLKPEETKKWLTEEELEALNQDEPLLTHLLKNSGYKVYYNSYPFQGKGGDINTCGRHAVVRLLFKDVDLDDYREIIKATGMSPDQFVSATTYALLKK
jgi:hypothetical protein